MLTLSQSAAGKIKGTYPAGIPGCPKGNSACWRGSECPCGEECCCGNEEQVRGPQGCVKCPLPSEHPNLSILTCGCGTGYYKPDGRWVSGEDVRAGLAPPKPGSTLSTTVTKAPTSNASDQGSDGEA